MSTGKEQRTAVRTDLLKRAGHALMASNTDIGEYTAGEIWAYLRADGKIRISGGVGSARLLIAGDLLRDAQDTLIQTDRDDDVNLADEIQIHLETKQRDLICDAEIELGVGGVKLARMMGAPYGTFKDWKSERRDMPSVARRCLELVQHAKPQR